MNTSIAEEQHGLYAMPPLALLFATIICTVAYICFSLLQITGTEQTIFDLLQVGVQINPGLTGVQVQGYLNSQLDHNHLIAAAIGFSVQIALFLISFSPDHALATNHRKHNTVVTASLARQAAKLARIWQFLSRALIAFDVVTDFYFVVQGSFRWDGWHPSFVGTVGVFLVGVIYPLGVIFVTLFAGKFMFIFGDALVDCLRKVKQTPRPSPAPPAHVPITK